MRVPTPVLTGVPSTTDFFGAKVMTPDVPLPAASKEVPPLPPSGNWSDQPNDGDLPEAVDANDTPIEQEIIVEPGHVQALAGGHRFASDRRQ